MDRPTLFSSAMVLALLRETRYPGTGKTQTRRLASSPLAKCQPGDRLWVRETWAHYQTVNGIRRPDGRAFSEVSDGLAGYRADGFDTIADFKDHIRLMSGCDLEAIEVNGDCWRPSIHMPRWASRLTLVVQDVRFQNLQDISEQDAQAEGLIQRQKGPQKGGWHWDEWSGEFGDWAFAYARDAYAELWETLHGDDAWDKNPPVVALTFAVHAVNIDAMEAANGPHQD
jgi:hypothetical protein